MGIKKVAIALRFHPFSRVPGSRFLLPKTALVKTTFPSLIQVHDLAGGLVEESATPPVARERFLHRVNWEKEGGEARLSFGIHKAQDVDKIRNRLDPLEYLPLWFRLGQYYLDRTYVPQEKKTLLSDLMNEMDKEKLLDHFEKLFLAGFSQGFVPRIVDDERHGFSMAPTIEDPMDIIVGGAKKIRSMFLEELGDELLILPKLPSRLVAGRLIHVQTKWGEISIDWTKRFLRRVTFTEIEGRGGMPKLLFPKQVKSWRYLAQGQLHHWDCFLA